MSSDVMTSVLFKAYYEAMKEAGEKTVSVKIPEKIVRKIDNIAKEYGMTRSEFIRWGVYLLLKLYEYESGTQ